MKKLFFLFTLTALSFTAQSQVKVPAPSPESTVEQVVGLTEFSVNYSRPSVKGREIFGGLVPFNEMWRTGANGSTDIQFNTDIQFGDTPVKAGKYSIYTYPGESSWRVLLYSDTEVWGTPGDSFDQAKVVAQTTVQPQSLSPKMETFTILFDQLRNNGADLVIAWDDTVLSIPLTVDSRSVVQKSIDETLSGPSANDYHSAASFYYEEEIDLNKALEWSKKATSMNENAFWMLKLQSEIQAKLGDYDAAIATANKSKAAAQKAGNDQYVQFNDDNIAAWKKMK